MVFLPSLPFLEQPQKCLSRTELNIAENTYITNRISDNLKDPVPKAIEKFKTHSSFLIIKDKIFQVNKFSFTEVSQSEIEKEIRNLYVKKLDHHFNYEVIVTFPSYSLFAVIRKQDSRCLVHHS